MAGMLHTIREWRREEVVDRFFSFLAASRVTWHIACDTF